MGSIRSQFADSLMFDGFGVVTGSVTAIQFPTGSVGMMRLKADIDNVGTFKLGERPDNCLFPMRAGDDTGWVSTSNLNRYYYQNNSGTTDYLYWWLQD